jgi:hypothetical protein
MSDATETTTPLRKILTFAAFVLVLVVLPGGAYYYLSEGYKWRKTAQSELKNDFGKIRPAFVVYADGQRDDQLKGKVCVVHYFGEQPDLTPANKQILDTGEELFKQFGYKPQAQRDEFRMVMIAEGGTAEFKTHAQTLPSSEMVNWVWTGGLGSWRTILENGFNQYCYTEKVKPYPEYYALTDTSGIIRRFYNAQDEGEVNRMVQQIALLLPK